MESSINLCLSNSVLFQLPWSYLRRNLSGKYHVSSLCGTSPTFERLKGDRAIALEDGIYVDLGRLCKVELLGTTLDLTELLS